ncbi:MAG: hypothetical protein RIS47_393 [Bacteroidota bacterium]|jgi:hypothetical protein
MRIISQEVLYERLLVATVEQQNNFKPNFSFLLRYPYKINRYEFIKCTFWDTDIESLIMKTFKTHY